MQIVNNYNVLEVAKTVVRRNDAIVFRSTIRKNVQKAFREMNDPETYVLRYRYTFTDLLKEMGIDCDKKRINFLREQVSAELRRGYEFIVLNKTTRKILADNGVVLNNRIIYVYAASVKEVIQRVIEKGK